MCELKKASTIEIVAVIIISLIFVVFFTGKAIRDILHTDIEGKCLSTHTDMLDNLFTSARGLKGGKVTYSKMTITDCVNKIIPNFDCGKQSFGSYCIIVKDIQQNISTKGVSFDTDITDCDTNTPEKELIPGEYKLELSENSVRVINIICDGSDKTTCPCPS